MRKTLLYVGVFLMGLYSMSSYAQGNYGGKKSIGLSYMGIDKGYGINANYQQLVGESYFGYRVDLDYLDRDMNISVYEYTYKTDFSRYTLGSAVTFNFEKWITFPFNLQLFAGGIIGQEKINNGKKEIDGIPYEKPTATVFGGYGGIEFEMSIKTRFSIALYAKNAYTSSKVQKSVFNYGLGLKYNLNDY